MRSATAIVMLVLAVALGGAAERADAASAPAYRAVAERVCATANTRLAALPVPRTSGDVLPWLERTVPIMSASTRRIQALRPPSALRARHRAWTVALGRRAATARALLRSVAAGAPPVASLDAALPRLDAQKRTARARARALGLRACSGRR